MNDLGIHPEAGVEAQFIYRPRLIITAVLAYCDMPNRDEPHIQDQRPIGIQLGRTIGQETAPFDDGVTNNARGLIASSHKAKSFSNCAKNRNVLDRHALCRLAGFRAVGQADSREAQAIGLCMDGHSYRRCHFPGQ